MSGLRSRLARGLRVLPALSTLTGLLLLAPTLAATQEPDHREPPPPFGPELEAEAEAIRVRLAELRRQLLGPGPQVEPERLLEISAELRPAYDRLAELGARRDAWVAYQLDPDGPWWRGLDGEPPALVAAGPAPPAGPVDLVAFHLLAKRLAVLDYFLTAPAHVDAVRSGFDPPTVDEGLAIARALEPFATGAVSVGGVAADVEGALRLRARYLAGRARVVAAWMRLVEGDAAGARALWRAGLEDLTRVEHAWRSVLHGHVDPTPLAVLPRATEEQLAELRRRRPIPFVPLSWGLETHRQGLGPGGAAAASTFDDLARLLEGVAPWTPAATDLLIDRGPLRGLDLAVLRGPEVGTAHRGTFPGIGEVDAPKLWVRSLGAGELPPNVAAELDELRRGIVPDSTEVLEWRAIRGAEELTVWVISPRTFDLKPSQVLTYTSKALTLAGCGAVAIAADILGDVAGAAAEELFPGSTAAQVATGVGAESVPYEVVWGKDGGVELSREGFNPMAMAKGGLLAILGAVEKAEVEALFEGLDPEGEAFGGLTGRPRGYAGDAVPPIVLRAMVCGWERTDPEEYARLRVYTRYWVLDLGALLGIDGQVDLATHTGDGVPGAAALLTGDVAGSARVWKPVPWAAQPGGWGSRARTASIQPVTQSIRVTVDPGLEASWREAVPAGHQLALVLRSEASRGLVHAGSLDGPLELCDAAYGERMGMGAQFRRTPLLARYEAAIVRAPVSVGRYDPMTGEGTFGPVFAIDDPTAVELATFPVRLASRDGARPTGTVTYDETGLHLTLEQRYEETPIRDFDLEPAPSGGGLVPAALVVQPAPYGGPPYEVSAYRDRLEVAVAYVPAEAGLRYRLDLRVEGDGLSMDYVAHAVADLDYGGAVFRVRVPVPQGSSRVHLSVGGAAPATRTLSVEREPARDGVGVDPSDHDDELQRQLEDRARARQRGDREDELDEHAQVLYVMIRQARCMADLERWLSARNQLHEVEGAWPNTSGFGERLARTYANTYEDYLEVLADVTFHQGDVQTFGAAARNLLAIRLQDAEESVARSGGHESTYRRLAETVEGWLADYLILGGGEHAAPLRSAWLDLRLRSGLLLPTDELRHDLTASPGGSGASGASGRGGAGGGW